jgi:transcriptional regulator with XRE-family HTH domain
MEPAAILAQMRQVAGLTQAELARRSGIPRPAINSYERGHRVPASTTLLRLAEACGLSLAPVPRPTLDMKRNGEALAQALDLAALLPTRQRADRLEFPSLLEAPGRRSAHATS